MPIDPSGGAAPDGKTTPELVIGKAPPSWGISAFVFIMAIGLMVVLPAILLFTWWQRVGSGTPLDAFQILALLAMLSLLVLFGLVMFQLGRLGLRPTQISAAGLYRHTNEYPWSVMERVYLNPGLPYVVFLFFGLQGKANLAGIVIDKKDIGPHWQQFVDLLISFGAPVEPTAPLTNEAVRAIEARRK